MLELILNFGQNIQVLMQPGESEGAKYHVDDANVDYLYCNEIAAHFVAHRGRQSDDKDNVHRSRPVLSACSNPTTAARVTLAVLTSHLMA